MLSTCIIVQGVSRNYIFRKDNNFLSFRHEIVKKVSFEKGTPKFLFYVHTHLLEHLSTGFNTSSYSRFELSGQSLQKIFRDRRQELPDEMLYFYSATRLSLVNFFLHVATHKKKFNGLRSGERGGHIKSDSFDINLPRKLTSGQSTAILDMWAEAPSSMKMVQFLIS